MRLMPKKNGFFNKSHKFHSAFFLRSTCQDFLFFFRSLKYFCVNVLVAVVCDIYEIGYKKWKEVKKKILKAQRVDTKNWIF